MTWMNERVTAMYRRIRVKGKVVHQEGKQLLVTVEETENSTIAAVGNKLIFSTSEVVKEKK